MMILVAIYSHYAITRLRCFRDPIPAGEIPCLYTETLGLCMCSSGIRLMDRVTVDIIQHLLLSNRLLMAQISPSLDEASLENILSTKTPFTCQEPMLPFAFPLRRLIFHAKCSEPQLS